MQIAPFYLVSNFVPAGAATEHFLHLAGQLAALRGLDSEGEVMRSLDRYLQEAGLLQVEAQRIQAPLGDWGGHLGSLFSLDARETWKAISAPIAVRFQLPQQEVLGLIDRAGQGWNEPQTKWSFVIAYSQKPAAS